MPLHDVGPRNQPVEITETFSTEDADFGDKRATGTGATSGTGAASDCTALWDFEVATDGQQ